MKLWWQKWMWLGWILVLFSWAQAQNPESLGGQITDTPSCVSTKPNTLSCFVRGAAGDLYQKSWKPGWSDWKPLGGRFVEAPSCTSWGADRIDCFAKGTDQTLQHLWMEGDQVGQWESLGGGLSASPECLSTQKDEVTCLVKGLDGAAYQKTWQGKWSDWKPLGGVFLDTPECVTWAAGRIDCFARGTDRQLYHNYTDDTQNWHDWETLRGDLTSRASCVTEGVNQLSCFARGGDRALYKIHWNGERFSGWEKQDGALASDPECVQGFSGQTDCFFAGDGRTFDRLAVPGIGKAVLKPQSGSPTGKVNCLSWGPERIDCFARGEKQDLLHWWFDAPLVNTQLKVGEIQIQLPPYPTGTTSAQAFFQALLAGPSAKPIKKNPSATGLQDLESRTETQSTPTGNQLCQVRRVSFNSNPQEFVTFEGSMNNLWLGNLAQESGLKGGSYKSLSVPTSERKNLVLYLGGLNFPGNREVVEASPAGVSAGLGSLVSRFKSSGLQAGAGILYSKVTVSDSLESSMLQAGFNGSFLTSSVNASISKRYTSKRNKVTGLFVQKVYNVALDLQGQSPAVGLLGNTPVSTLESLGASKELSYSNVPAYVSNIAFGRIVALTMESNYTESQMIAAIEASYSGVFTSVQGNLKTDLRKVLSESSIEVKVLGGDEESAKRLLQTGRFADYFSLQSTPIETYRPIAYTLRYLTNDDVAAINKTTEFEIKECSASSVALRPQFRFTLLIPDDDTYDDLYGTITVDGVKLYNVPEERNTPVYPLQTVMLADGFGDRTYNVNFGEDQFMHINGLLMDHDAGPNDRVANWDLNFNLREVADAYQRGAAFFEKTFVSTGEADSLVHLIVRFDFK